MFDVYFGAPGSGKSTMACKLARRALKKKRAVYSNVEIKGCYELDPRRDIGRYDIRNALVIIDEAGIEYNNREFKSFSQEQNKWFKLYRHAKCDIVIFSQSYEDMDKKLRLLANRYFLVERSILPKFIRLRRISKRIAISDIDKSIIDAYEFVPFSRRLIFGPLYWKYFDSYVMPKYETKEWTVFGSVSQITDGLPSSAPRALGTKERNALWRIRQQITGLVKKTKMYINSITKR